VTSLAWFGDDVLAPLLARFSARHTLVTIDLINDPRRFNLARREADIALRIGSFDQEIWSNARWRKSPTDCTPR
jgi:DNA-binding transcriptional LysR family regulator